MQEINLNETHNIIGGGLNITGTLISAVRGYINTILIVGQTVGGAIRRLTSNNLCKF